MTRPPERRKDPVRRAYLDRSPGEVRAAVTLDGRPERLLLEREGDDRPRVGARYAARVEAVSERMGLARLDLGTAQGSVRLKGLTPRPSVGARIEAEVVVEPRRDKPALLRSLGPTSDPPGLLQPPPSLEAQLALLGLPDWETGEAARDAADEAQAAALAVEHAIGSGVTLTVEPTRALTAIDVDLAESGAAVSVARANTLAIGHVARLLRLKSLGGLTAVDLIGFPHDAPPLRAAATEAFRPDGPEVAISGPGRFGLLEVARPHDRQPLHERLLDPDGRPNALAAALDLVRALERQGRFDPGTRLVALCAPEVAPLAAPLAARLGPRFLVRGEVGVARDRPDIRPL